MNNVYKYLVIFMLTVAFSGSGFFLPGIVDFDQMVSVAEADHKPGHKPKKPKDSPPTVSELPIEYMIPVGFTMILISGGILFLIKKRNRQNT